MSTNTLVVDRGLGAVPVARLLEVRTQIRATGNVTDVSSAIGDRPVLSGAESLVSNTLYPSEKNTSLRYYLPEYRIALNDGKPAVELQFKPGPDGECGRLTITLTWTPPAAPGLEVRTIDHVTALTLNYQVPVQVQGVASSGGLERTMALQPLQSAGPLLARSTTVFTDKGLFDSVYQALRTPEHACTLNLAIRARVGVRTWRQVIVRPPAVADQANVLQNRGVLFTGMLHAESVATIRRVPPSGAAHIQMQAAPPDLASQVNATRSIMMATPVARQAAVRSVTATLGTTVAAGASPAVTLAARAPVAVRPTAPALGAVVMRAAAAPATVNPFSATLVTDVARAEPTGDLLMRVNTPRLAAAVAQSDLEIAGRRAVPMYVALDTTRLPAVVDAELDSRQGLAFTFDPQRPENRDVFIAEGAYSSAIHILIPLLLNLPSGQKTVYRDSLMPNVVHVPPSGFRLDRESTAPFLPAISFLASDFSTTETDVDADVLFRVVAAYRLEPWIDPDVVEAARKELANLGQVATFTTSSAHNAKLTLNLLGNDELQTGATVDPITGITDTLDFDYQSFERFWRDYLVREGVTGWVEYEQFDRSLTKVPVRLSLRDTCTELFRVSFVGPVSNQPGRLRVKVQNRVESPARITALPAELVAGGVAYPVNAEALVSQVLQPGEAREIDYDTSGTTAPVLDFTPTIVGETNEPNQLLLLKLLMVTKGFNSLSFSVTVLTPPETFGQAAGSNEPLTGLLVEFDDGTQARLTPSNPSVQVTLMGRLLDQILGAPTDESQKYFYRVTNLHASGEGARTSWELRQGAGELKVSGAVVKLDF